MKSYITDRNLGKKALVAVVLLAAWQVASQFFAYYVFPSIPELLTATQTVISDPQFGTYRGNVTDTFRRLLAGFAISVVVGTIVGTAMGLREDAEAFLRSWIVLGLSVPAIAVAFALIIAIGISEWVPVLTVVIVGVPFVILNMWEGTQELDPEITEMADFFGASTLQKYRDILLPQVLEYLFPSMYWGLVVSWKVLFIAEVFGAGSGVGYMVNYWFQQQRVDLLLGWVLIPVLLIILAQEGLRAAEHRLMKWR
ncbi:ABC transporter permease [Halobellus clavatus]|jgi:NitT/TauT family transport system permease protein|uniref:NitT/TauT family transport system permease protein n=1 Tax=Halobellus clavatus TaxID=660517 RepID=A0A1H3H1U3_9EURY|nr:ABC transporter permease subunit [Halobellus clavatus]SDY09290.1 NitT/TauT family transport system permease protein [Halobellus clavatus]